MEAPENRRGNLRGCPFHITRREVVIDAIVYPYQLFDPAQV